MAGKWVLFRCLGEAILAVGLDRLADLNGYVKFVKDIGADALRRWRERQKADAAQPAARQELEEAAQAPPPQFEGAMRQLVAEVAPQQPLAVRQVLTAYLTLIPAQIRQTFARPEDPTGTTVPAAWALQQPDDLLPLLPPRLPRFQGGDHPPNSPKWVLTERLGLGGFGEVWKARHTLLPDRYAAFKFCLDPAAQQRLIQHEARVINQVMTQLDHPGIVKLQEVDFNADAPWLQYEYVAGGDLGQLVARWPADPAQRTRLATTATLTLARTIGYCHRLHPPVVHRDLKPTNVLVARTADGKLQLKITDFGISAVTAGLALDEARRATQVAAFSTPSLIRRAYTPWYASPQQRDGAEAHLADDVHALGVIFYQLLLGNPNQPPGLDYRDDLAELGLCDAVIGLVGRCVAAKVDRRLADATQLVAELEKLPAQLLKSATVVSVPAATPVPPSGPPAPTLDHQLDTLIHEAEATNAQARKLLDGHDYAGAVTALEKIRLTRLREESLYTQAKTCRDRVEQLETTIRPRVLAGPHDGLLELVEELLGLTPANAEMARVRDRLRKLEATLAPKPGTPFINSLGMPFAFVPRGTFWIGGGSGQPGEIPHDFYLGIYPVTQAQWQAVMGNNPSYFSRSGGGKDKVTDISDADLKLFPVESVSMEDVQDFLHKVNARVKATEWLYRLPTEAEWEYGCRGGASSKSDCSFDFYLDKPSNDLSSNDANFDGSHPAGKAPRAPYLERTSTVGSYKANRLGIFDLHGNVWEWCEDLHEEGSVRVIRGGSWRDPGERCQAASRRWLTPSVRNCNLGCRLARVPSG